MDVARVALERSAKDHSADPGIINFGDCTRFQINMACIAAFREDLLNIARTTLSSKILSVNKAHFANLCVNAVLRLHVISIVFVACFFNCQICFIVCYMLNHVQGSMDLSHIQIVKIIGGQLEDSYLDDGFLLMKKIGVGQPKRMENCRILVANTALDTDKIKIPGARVRAEGIQQVAEIEEAERHKMTLKVQKIMKHNINCFISRQLIYNFPEQMFTKAGILSIEHADFEGVERLALVLGAEITSTFDHPELVRLGECKLIEEVVIGEDKLIRFSGVARGEACTIVIRGASQHILEEAERSLHDALCILTQTTQNPRTVLGGGCSEMLMANEVDVLARSTSGKQSIAMESFAKALRMLPTIIADNGGFDSSELVSQLRAHHFNGRSTMGLDMNTGTVGDVAELKITESFKSKSQVVISAHEAAEMILRVDDIISCAPRSTSDLSEFVSDVF